MHYTPFDVPLKEYEGLICRREYWDGLGTEWGWSTVEEKIIRLAGFVQQGGNLKKVINHFRTSSFSRFAFISERIALIFRNPLFYTTFFRIFATEIITNYHYITYGSILL